MPTASFNIMFATLRNARRYSNETLKTVVITTQMPIGALLITFRMVTFVLGKPARGETNDSTTPSKSKERSVSVFLVFPSVFLPVSVCRSLHSVCLSVCLSACLAVRLSTSFSLCLSLGDSPSVSLSVSVCLSACRSACLSVCLPVCPHLSLRVSLHPTPGLPLYLSLCLLLYLSVWLSAGFSHWA